MTKVLNNPRKILLYTDIAEIKALGFIDLKRWNNENDKGKEMKEKFLKLLEKLGLINEENKNDVATKIDEEEIKELLGGETKVDIPDKLDDATKAIVEKLIEQNKALAANVKSLKDALAEEKAQREAAIKAEQERIEKENKEKVANAVKKLLDEKKITEADKEIWQKLYEKDFEAAEKAAGQLQPPKAGDKGDKVDNNGNENANMKPGKPDRKALREAIAEQMENYN